VSEPLTERRLDEIEARARVFADRPKPIVGDHLDPFWLSDGGSLASRPVRQALVLAQDDVPALLAEVRRLRAERGP